MQAPAPEPGSGAGAKRGSSGVRLLRGHKAAVTALALDTRWETAWETLRTPDILLVDRLTVRYAYTKPFFFGCIETF
jgi:hypothetical protein